MLFGIDSSERNFVCLQLSFDKEWRHNNDLHDYHDH